MRRRRGRVHADAADQPVDLDATCTNVNILLASLLHGPRGCLKWAFSWCMAYWRDAFGKFLFSFFFYINTNTNTYTIYNSIFVRAAGYASAYLAYPVPPPLRRLASTLEYEVSLRRV